MRYPKRDYRSVLKISIYILLLFFSVTLLGCPSKNFGPIPAEISSQEDLGGIHVTVFPVVDFENYRDKLSPKFTLTGDAALNVVAPYTASNSYSKFSGISGALSVGLPTSTGTETITKSTAEGITKKTIEDIEVNSSGIVPGSLPGNEFKGKEFGQNSTNPALSRLDPMTQYWTAAALFQEVQLLNRYIKDLYPGNDLKAYVVRLQISQIPYVRRAPYDSIVDLSFFLDSKDGKTATKLPVVLPMLVTDNMESSLGSYHSETVRSLALALQGMVGQVGANLGGSAYSQLVKEILGRDINSLYTIGRLHDNVLRVRLAAMQQSNDLYAVVPHTQNVTVLLLAEEASIKTNKKIVVTSKTEWKHATDPEKNFKQSSINIDAYFPKLNAFLSKTGYKEVNFGDFKKLINNYNANDFETFYKTYNKTQETKSNKCEKDYDSCIECLKDKAKGLTEARNLIIANESKIANYKSKNKKLSIKLKECKKQIATKFGDIDTFSNEDIPLPVENPNNNAVVYSMNPGGDYTSDGMNSTGNPFVKIVWGMIASLSSESSFDQSSVYIPEPPATPTKPATPPTPDNRTPIYLFDNTERISATIPQFGKTYPSKIHGVVEFCYDIDVKDGAQSVCPISKTFPLFSTTTIADSNQRNIILQFPSVLKLKYKKLSAKKMTLWWADKNDDFLINTFTKLVLVPPSDEIKLKSKVAITDNKKYLAILNKNQANLRLNAEKIADTEKDLVLSISGARLKSVIGAGVKQKLNVVEIKTPGTFSIELENVIQGEKVTLTLSSKSRGLRSELATLEGKANPE